MRVNTRPRPIDGAMIRDLQKRNLVFLDPPVRGDDGQNEAAVERGAALPQCKHVERIRVLVEVEQHVQQTRSDHRGQNDDDAQIEDLLRIDPGFFGATRRQPDAEQKAQGEHEAVGPDGELANVDENRMHLISFENSPGAAPL